MNRKEQLFIADTDNLNEVLAFVDEYLEAVGCSMKIQMQIDVSLEEMFVNVARYAYREGESVSSGDKTVLLEVSLEEESHSLLLTLTDQGIPFDPTARRDPDVTLSLEEREIGGLGIYMAKKNMDEMTYERRDGKNILHMRKKLS